VCYDSTGGSCNNENCSDTTAPTNTSVNLKDDIHLVAVQKAKEGPVSWSTLSAAQLIEESPWLADADFPQTIRGLAPYLSDLVLSLQDQLKRRNHLPAREGRTIGGYIYFRDDYAAHFTVMKAGNVWRLELSPDPKNPDAPNIVEILGRNWQLVHHVHEETGQKVVARGTY
jgi:hypothetical protein